MKRTKTTKKLVGQMELPIVVPRTISTVQDPYWDEITAPQHTATNESVGEQLRDTTIAPQHPFISQSVGEQPVSVTTTAPQHPPTKYTHWVEKYWVERGSKKHYYWRYMWIEGEGQRRKNRRCYLGRYGDKVEAVELAIAEGLSPIEIKHMIVNWKTTQA